MFQFPTFASLHYVFMQRWPFGRVSPFRYPRINAYSQLPAAFRSVSRLSSPLIAKASTKCPYLSLDSYNINISLFISLLNKKSFLSTRSLFTEKLRLCIFLYLFPRFFDNTIFSYHTIQLFPYLQCFIASQKRYLVEVRRIELLAPCLQSRCSPSWAIPPTIGGSGKTRTSDLTLIRRTL